MQNTIIFLDCLGRSAPSSDSVPCRWPLRLNTGVQKESSYDLQSTDVQAYSRTGVEVYRHRGVQVYRRTDNFFTLLLHKDSEYHKSWDIGLWEVGQEDI